MDTYQQSYTILASDMDMTYHITPNAILLYFQDCFARSLSSRRLAAFDIIGDDLIWVISEFDLHFLRERPLWSSEISVSIRFKEISKVRIYVDYQIRNHKGQVFVEGDSTWVVLNHVSKRPVRAQEMLAQGGILSCGKHEGQRVVPDLTDKHFLREVDHAVNVTDLDFNGHVCNRSYLSISIATFPPEFIRSFSPSYIHLRFVKEAFMGEVLTCRISRGSCQQYWFDIFNEKEEAICNIYSEWKDDHEMLSRNVADQIER